MNKKIVAGAVVLGAVTMVGGLTGCGKDDVAKYTVIFDANNNGVRDNDEQVIEFEQGATSVDLPAYPVDAETGFAGVWEDFTMKDENIVVKAKYGNGSQSNPYLISTAAQFAKMLREENLNTVYYKLLNNIDFSTQQGNFGAAHFCAVVDGNGYSLTGLSTEQFADTNGCLVDEMIGGSIKNLTVEWVDGIGALVNEVVEGNNSIVQVNVRSAKNNNMADASNPVYFDLTEINKYGAMLVNTATAGTIDIQNCNARMWANAFGWTGEDCFNWYIGTVGEQATVNLMGNTHTGKAYTTCNDFSYVVKFGDIQKRTAGDSITAPSLAEQNGFAGIWVNADGEAWSGFNNKSETLTAKYGDGTQANPYLVETATQFARILTNHSSGTATYFKLLADIDLSNVQVCGNKFSGEIDGNGHILKNVTGSNFIATEGAMFDTVNNATFKNLTIELGDNIASIAACTTGTVTFENITIANASGVTTFITADDNNEGPFIQRVGNGTTTFTNCTNNAHFMSTASYFGVFVGGYAAEGSTVNFNNCVNSGSITSAGSVGILIGNPYKGATNITVDGVVVKDSDGFKQNIDLTEVRSQNTGNITTNAHAHFLVSRPDFEFTADRVTLLDDLNTGTISKLTVNCKTLIFGSDVEVVATNSGANLPAGDYELILSAMAQNDRTAVGGMSLLTNISIKVTIGENETSKLFQNVLHGFKDLQTYKTEYSVTDEDLADVQWTNIKGYQGIKYFLDSDNGVYVIDYTEYETANGLLGGDTDNRLKVNANVGKVSKLMLAYRDGKVINFVTSFAQGRIATFDINGNGVVDESDIKVKFSAGDSSLSSVPAIPNSVDGQDFAPTGWKSYTLGDEDILIQLDYATGVDAENAHIIKTSAQFATLLNKYGSQCTYEYTKDGAPSTEAEADTRIAHFATVDVSSTKTGGKWGNGVVQAVRRTFFKLEADIDLSQLTGNQNSANYLAGEIDFNGHKLLNADGGKFESGEGAMIRQGCDLTIKNLTVEMGDSLMTLLAKAYYGTVNLTDITINNAAGKNYSVITANDNNEGPFVFFVVSGTLNMTNCVNNADYISYSAYSGVFVGGYAIAGTKVNFNNCVNNGDILSSASIGLFFGNQGGNTNGRIGKDDYTITNCSNTGDIRTYGESHILISDRHTQFDEDNEYSSLDNADGYNPITKLDSTYTATKDGYNVVIGADEVSVDGKECEMIISAFASNCTDGAGYMTLRTNISIAKTGSNGALVFDGVVNSMMDTTTYEAYLQAQGKTAPTDTEWTNISGYVGVRYFVDAVNHIYVVDYSGYNTLYGLQANPLRVNITFDRCEKTIVVKQADQVLDFVVEIGNTSGSQGLALGSVIESVNAIDENKGSAYAIGITSTSQLAYINATQNGEELSKTVTPNGDKFDYSFTLNQANYVDNPVTLTYCHNGKVYSGRLEF